MSKTVLLIESDAPFARDMSAALEAKGFAVRSTPDGKEGVELARALRPDCVVLCVELPGLSGYSWCNRLKKDDTLKRIPLVITSAEATPETFEQHRKLKTRAEDYLVKPFPPATLVERIGALIGMPEVPADGDEELVTLADVDLDVAADGGANPVEQDADLRMLDDAFDSISGGGGDEPSTRAPGAPVAEPPLTLLPDADESPAVLDLDREMAEALASLAEEGAAPARASDLVPAPAAAPVRLVHPTIEPAPDPDETPILLEDVEVLPTVDVTEDSSAAALLASKEETWNAELSAVRSRLESSEGLARTLGGDLEAARKGSRIAQERAADLERELGELRTRLEEAARLAAARGAEAAEAAGRADEATGRADELERALSETRTAFTATRATTETLQAEAETLRAGAETLRAEGETLRAEGAALRTEIESLRSQIESLRSGGDALRSEVEAVRAERDSLRAEVASLQAAAERQVAEAAAFRSEAESARSAEAAFRSDVETRLAGHSRRIQEMEAQAAQHEDRLLRAYQKIKSDEKLREKTRRALAMVIQVLEERSAADAAAPPATPER